MPKLSHSPVATMRNHDARSLVAPGVSAPVQGIVSDWMRNVVDWMSNSPEPAVVPAVHSALFIVSQQQSRHEPCVAVVAGVILSIAQWTGTHSQGLLQTVEEPNAVPIVFFLDANFFCANSVLMHFRQRNTAEPFQSKDDNSVTCTSALQYRISQQPRQHEMLLTAVGVILRSHSPQETVQTPASVSINNH